MNQQVLAAIAAVLVAVLPFIRSYALAKFSAQRIATVHQLSTIAVNAAERVGAAETSVDGAAKFTIASNFLVDAAKRVGVRLTGDEVNGFVHSALRDLEAAAGIVKEQTTPPVPPVVAPV